MSAARNGNRVCVNCKHFYAAHGTAENEQQARPCYAPGCSCRSVTHIVLTWVGWVRGSDPAGKDQSTFLVHRKQDPPEQGEEIVGHGKTPKARHDAALLEYRRRQSERST